MSLRMTPVSKCLEKRLVMFGFEVADLMAVFLTLSVLNFLFGQTQLKLYLVWLPTISLAAVLRFGKRGKPENYLIHWIRFQIKPGIYSAFSDPTLSTPPPRRRKKVKS